MCMIVQAALRDAYATDGVEAVYILSDGDMWKDWVGVYLPGNVESSSIIDLAARSLRHSSL